MVCFLGCGAGVGTYKLTEGASSRAATTSATDSLFLLCPSSVSNPPGIVLKVVLSTYSCLCSPLQDCQKPGGASYFVFPAGSASWLARAFLSVVVGVIRSTISVLIPLWMIVSGLVILPPVNWPRGACLPPSFLIFAISSRRAWALVGTLTFAVSTWRALPCSTSACR